MINLQETEQFLSVFEPLSMKWYLAPAKHRSVREPGGRAMNVEVRKRMAREGAMGHLTNDLQIPLKPQ